MILNNIIDKTATNIHSNMKPTTPKNNSISFVPAKPVPRILIIQTAKKWKGCIYISLHDLTGQVFMYLKDSTIEFKGYLHKTPIFSFASKDKSEVENLISEKLQSILKNK
jgi:hypothetical protein